MITNVFGFDIVNNNCWHEVMRQYEDYWGRDCPVAVRGERPDNLMHLHRGALRLVDYFGIAKEPSCGCIVLLSKRNLIHHFGFFKDGIITSLCRSGLHHSSLEQLNEKGFNVKFLNTDKKEL